MSTYIPNISNEPKQRNRRLLEIMDKQLSKMHSFVEYSNKLAKWANDPRAYYDDVKEIIIKLLERALLTLQTELGLDPRAPLNIHHYTDKPYIDAYKNLIHTVYRFRDKFPRDGLHLQSRLQALYMTITLPDNIIDIDAMSSTDSTAIVHNSSPQSSPPAVTTPSTVPPSAVTGIISSSSQNDVTTTTSKASYSTGKPPPVDSTTDASFAPVSLSNFNPVDSTTTYFISPPFSSSSANAEPFVASPTPPPVINSTSHSPERRQSDEPNFAIIKPRKRKRRKLNLSEMLNLDQEDQVESTLGLPIPAVSSEVQTSEVVEDNSHRTTNSPVVPSSVEAVTSNHPMQEDSIVGTKRARSGSASSHLTDRGPGSHSPSFIDRTLISQSPAPTNHTKDERSPLSITSQPMEGSFTISELLPTPLIADRRKSVGTLSAIQSTVDSIADRENRLTDVEDAMDTTDDIPQALSMMKTPPTTSNEILPEPIDAPPEITTDSQPVTIPIDKILTVEASLMEMRPRTVSLPKSPGFSKTLTTRKQDGLKKTAQVTMRFVVAKEQFISIENWNNRRTSPISEDRQDTLCFSLACYYRADVEKNSGNYSALRSRWPKRQRLDLNVTKRDGSNQTIPLSPPTACTPDGLVDLGSFIKQGENTIKISQKGDLSAYVFCLHVHEPTLAQIQRLNQVLDDDLEWENWCKSVSGPLNLPPSTFVPHPS
ncbi:hypothetical protein GGU11DRAFT_790213 [Lentinula aff. detonsa]|nr:hypothetical protein GGU11DRAFT_790213 [Lentinula aff. detonsa]